MINLKKYFIDDLAEPLFFKKNKNIINNNKKNKVKYYIIHRSPGAGMFSNINYILNHVKYAKKQKLIPIVDMENFTTIYNEFQKVNNTKNAWEYYFHQFTKKKLKKIYNAGNYIFSRIENLKPFINRLDTDQEIIQLLKKIKFKKKILNEVNSFINKKI